jgi:hypothetical protein
LLIAFVAYAAASLLHHIHNAEFFAQYPMMPAWLSRTMVYAAWIVATSIGVLGYRLRRRGLLFVYGSYGLLGLAHYALAPVSAHTPVMNLSIALEVATAAALLILVWRNLTPFPEKGS